jgi:hypothetical protein
MIRRRSILLALIAALLSLAAATVAHAGQITSTRITDNFGGRTIDQSVWFYGTNDPNVSIAQRGGRVTVQVGAGAADGFNASLSTRCRLHGNFKAKLSYELVNWPGNNDSIDVSLGASDLGGVNVYASDDFGGGYGAYFPPNGSFLQTTVEPRGTLKLVRDGATFTGYARDRVNHRWVQLYSGPGSTEDTGIGLGVFNIPFAAPFGGVPATIALTKVRVKADAVVCS